MMEGGQYYQTLCEILVAIDFGHKIHIFIPNLAKIKKKS